jgi:hypothetical protein
MSFGNGHPRASRLWILGLLAGLMLGPVTSAVIADGTMPPPRTGETSDDETIGTLPFTQGRTAVEVVRFLRDARPSMYIAGPAEDLFNSLLSADAIGGPVAATITDLGAGRIQITFHGAVRVLLDRQMTGLSGTVTVGLASQQSQSFPTRVQFGSRGGSLGNLSVGPTELPVLALSASGALDLEPLAVATRLAGGHTLRQSFAAAGNVLILTQGR